MKACVAATLLVHCSMLLVPATVIAAEPLPPSELEDVFVPPPAPRACEKTADNTGEDCTDPGQLNELTDYNIREATTIEQGKPASSLPPPQAPPEQQISPQQLQIIEDFTNRPWGR